MCCKAALNAIPAPSLQTAKEILYRISNREDIDDENISVTCRTNSTSISRCSSTYRSPPHSYEEGVLNLDTKSAKILSSDDSSAFNDVKPKPPSEHQTQLEAFQSSVEQQSSKAKSKKLSVADDAESVPQESPHEENGFEKSLDSFKHTKARRSTHKDDSAAESYAARDKQIPFLHRNYLPDNLERLYIPSVANLPLPFQLPLPNTENIRLYSQLLYPYHTHSGSDPPHSLIHSPFMNYQHHSLLFADNYRKEPPKFTSLPSPSRTSSPPKVGGAQPFPGSRVEPVLPPSQPSMTPIH